MSPDAFQQLVDRHYAALYRFGLSLSRNADAAADLVQQTFYLWAEKGHQLRDLSKAKSWLFTTLYREYLSTYRRNVRHPQVELDDTGNGSSPTTVLLDLKEKHATLVVNVGGLSGAQADLVLTAPSGETVPIGAPVKTVAGKATYSLPRGSWTVTATVPSPAPARSDSDVQNVTAPTTYTMNLTIPPSPATGATAGKPGTFTPAGTATPANLAALTGIVASPISPWASGQRVVLADSSTASWNGSAWVAGAAP